MNLMERLEITLAYCGEAGQHIRHDLTGTLQIYTEKESIIPKPLSSFCIEIYTV